VTTRVLLYLLPGLLAAVGALVGLASAERVTTVAVILTVTLVALGLAVPPLVDWLRARHLSQVAQQQLLAGRREEVARQRAAHLRDHFEPRGRGVLPSSVRTGSYFTGRVRVLRELVAWLDGRRRDDYRARVVTGGPGSGKSAVLGRLVSLADPQLGSGVTGGEIAAAPPGTVPALDSISVAVHALARTVDEVATEIARALNIDEPGVAGLLAVLREAPPPRPMVVLVDAVDEAGDPYRLIVELLEPLASAAPRTKIRLLVGARGGGGLRSHRPVSVNARRRAGRSSGAGPGIGQGIEPRSVSSRRL
jgi:hypothetical protein